MFDHTPVDADELSGYAANVSNKEFELVGHWGNGWNSVITYNPTTKTYKVTHHGETVAETAFASVASERYNNLQPRQA